eukprot:962519-Amphidinium_carterae.1
MHCTMTRTRTELDRNGSNDNNKTATTSSPSSLSSSSSTSSSKYSFWPGNQRLSEIMQPIDEGLVMWKCLQQLYKRLIGCALSLINLKIVKVFLLAWKLKAF